ncbi:RUN domain-containing protein 1-like [Mya arenaria]|uniref:RUN domain-containing protein 1-like n=1 Tax=Mya arenaria TaxID=6604 RepID=UPI0022DEF554|nr:RUN domain-containing protein 1-like [Mya arenaria]XP_052801155.1 RUN domain-containing protein 1-like [Mya arenaria]XP_052801156.1 RUN domain-containing protein 1-like [Mya arenaria]
MATTSEDNYDSHDDPDYDSDRPTERWAPLGAVSDIEPTTSHSEISRHSEREELERLEEEQEQLNSSLLALTTHFAQVQFRLKQIVSSDDDQKERLLKELEEFAFRGIPDVRGCTSQDAQILEEMSDREHEVKLTEQREKQRELITQLKSQLENLETYAYETGDIEELPTSRQMEKQKVVLDQLRNTLDLRIDKLDSLSTEELRQVVDHAVGQIVNPAKVKEKLVNQLKTQVTDLERFIDFLQGEATSPGPLGKNRCTCPVHAKSNKFTFDEQTVSKDRKDPSITKDSHRHAEMLKKTLHMMQVFLINQLGCGSRDFQRNAMKKTTKGNHWGDLRARLELAVDKVSTAARYQPTQDDESGDYNSESEESQEMSSPLLTQTVRKDLAMAIRDLFQHGLVEMSQNRTLVPWGCLPSRSAAITREMHAWDLLLKYYEMKHGQEYNQSPARKLSQSFHLEIVGGKAITSKQTLLGAINTVLTTHTHLKRSEDSHFKAFICLALNEGKLPQWMKLIFRTQTLVDNYYQDWSYVARTGFDDAIKSLDKLSQYKFNLPVDLAIRPFSNIKDAF